MKTLTYLERGNADPTAKELDAAIFAPLNGEATSPLAEKVCAELYAAAFHRSKRRNKLRLAAFAAIVCDLLQTAVKDPKTWSYRSLRNEGFTGFRVGARPFKKTLLAMQGMMVEIYAGTRQYVQSEFTGGTRQAAWDRATRFRATSWLLATLAGRGITPANWQEHFTVRSETSSETVVPLVRTKAKLRQGGSVHGGIAIPYDPKDPVQKALADRVHALNVFYAKHDIQPFGPVVLRRKFQNGDDPSFAWDCGGRLFAVGTGNYQGQKPPARRTITIDGEPTVEMDIRASHPTILFGLGVLKVDPSEKDPYLIEGIPRAIVKQWVNMTISNGRRHRTWPSEAVANYANEHGSNLRIDFPIRKVGDAILQKVPLLAEDGKTPKAHWGQLQFLEGEAMIKTVETLAFKHGVVGLPIHDSIIVPASKAKLAKAVLGDHFKEVTGAKPYIEEK